MAMTVATCTILRMQPISTFEAPRSSTDTDNQPIAEGSSVLAFMQSPTDTRHQVNILQSIVRHLVGREGFSLALATGLSVDFKCDLYFLGELSRMSRRVRLDPISASGFDYEHQAWVERGKYVRCGHPAELNCACFGRLHDGENVRA